MKQLFYDKPLNSYYFNCSQDDLIVNCQKCKKIIEIEDYVFIHNSWGRQGFDKSIYCRRCIKNHRKKIYDEFIVAEVSTKITKNSQIVVDNPPLLKNSTSVFDAALSNKNIMSDTSNVEIIDNTKLAFRREPKLILDMTDGKKKTNIKKLDAPVSIDEALEELK